MYFNLRRNSARRKNDEGVALVEFAIMSPFLVGLLVAIVDMGMLLDQYLHVVNIARDSARLAGRIPCVPWISYW